MSTLNVDKVDPSTGTALELGTSGDTVTVPSGVGLTLTDSTLLLPTTITSTTEVKTNKISPATGAAFALGDSGDTFTVPSGATIVNSGTATGFGASLRPNVNPLIINGDMAVSQRATSVAGLTNGSDVYVALDRFGFNEYGAPSSIHTMTQEALTADEAYEDGFSTALKMDVTTAQDPLSAADATMIIYKFEGQDLQLIKKGTANAEKLTLAFWVKGTKTGTHICELFDKDNTRTCSQSYTVDSTDTWEQKVVNFPADTTGVLDNDNARSLDISFFLSAGTNYTSGSLQTSWGAYSATESAVGQVNTCDSTSNNFHITGVQLEVGEYTSSTLPPFQHESYGDNLFRCQRYYETKGKYDSWVHSCYSTTIMYGYWSWITTKRAIPAVTIIGTNSAYSAGAAFSGTLAVTSTRSTCFGTSFTTTSITGGRAAHVANSGSNPSITIDAEL